MLACLRLMQALLSGNLEAELRGCQIFFLVVNKMAAAFLAFGADSLRRGENSQITRLPATARVSRLIDPLTLRSIAKHSCMNRNGANR
jgi:hypothetical protein